jgi:hypothetical protein
VSIVGTHKATGIPLDQADAVVMQFAEHELGCDPGKVPVGEITYAIRLCRDCARKTGVAVMPNTEGDPLPLYMQSPDT